MGHKRKGDTLLAISIDTEGDYQGISDWKMSDPLTFTSILDGIPNRLQSLFNDFDAKPTYLVTSEVLENDECIDILSSLEGVYELGTHLHGEYIEPQQKYSTYAGTVPGEYPCLYDKEIEFAKLENLTELFIKRFGFKPTSYRGGRFGSSHRTINFLTRLGYKVDTSVTPHVMWKDKFGTVDFISAPEQPYFPDVKDITKPGNSAILEVPVSIMKRLFRRPVWLRPSMQSFEQMINLIWQFTRNYYRNQLVVLNMMFHSMEIVPSCSPYTRSEEECRHFLSKLESVLAYSKKIGIHFGTLSDIHSCFSSRKNSE